MRVAVVGAGLVGVGTAFELAAQGHEVRVLERRSSVAAEGSFAQAGIVSPALVQPWSGPGLPWTWLPGLPARTAGVRHSASSVAHWPWLWRALMAQRAAVRDPNRSALRQLALASRERLLDLTRSLDLDFEQADGVLVLLPNERTLKAFRPTLRGMADAGLAFELVDEDRARKIEPALSPAAKLRAAVHLTQDVVGNGRQFAHRLKAEATRLGATFLFDTEVVSIKPGARPEIVDGSGHREAFDAVVLCTGATRARWWADAGLRLPLQPVQGLSVTAPINHVEGQMPQAPRAAVIDARQQVTMSRIGQRLRVSGCLEFGGRSSDPRPASLKSLYAVLEQWFPGSAVMREATHWKGSRPMLPDSLPLLGASGLPGVWLNLGHAGHGWALSCGSAQALAAMIAGRDPGVDTSRFSPQRWR